MHFVCFSNKDREVRKLTKEEIEIVELHAHLSLPVYSKVKIIKHLLNTYTTEAGLPQSSASTFLGQGLFTYRSGGLDSRVLRAPQTIQTRVYELL